MAYCFVFRAPPEGFGIISDRRLKEKKGLQELLESSQYEQGVIIPTPNSFMIIMGQPDCLNRILTGIPDIIEAARQNVIFHTFLQVMESRYTKLANEGVFLPDRPADATIIYGDFSRRRKTLKYRFRLLAIEFDFQHGKPIMKVAHGKDMDWTASGWTSEGRELLNDVAVNDYHKLIWDSKIDSGQGGKNNVLNVSGQRFREFMDGLTTLSKEGAAQDNQESGLNPLLFIGSSMMQALVDRSAYAIKMNMADHKTMGNEWRLATISRRSGFRLHGPEEIIRSLSLLENQK